MTGILKSVAGYSLVVLAFHSALSNDVTSSLSSVSKSAMMTISPLQKHETTVSPLSVNTVDIEQLTKGKWILQSAMANKPADTDYDGQATKDLYTELPACSKDDVLQFYDNGEAVFTRNQICNLGEQPYETCRWSIDHNRTVTLQSGSVIDPMTIQLLNADKMVVQMPFDTEGPNLNVTVTYVRPASTGKTDIADNE
jgi:hypothetical protein